MAEDPPGAVSGRGADGGGRGGPSLPARLLGTSFRGARRVAGATGLDEAADVALEEAIVQAVQSPAVERAVARVLEGRAFQQALERALASPAMERAAIQAIDSELVDHVWERLLASDEAQKLVERIAQAPEVRAAIAAQGVGLIDDLGRQLRRASNGLDDAIEGVVRRLLRRRAREGRTDHAGLVTRAVALAIDAGVLNGIFFVVSSLLAYLTSAAFPDADGVSTPALVIGAGAWVAAGATYLVTFWALAGQTPGMRFLSIYLQAGDSHRLGLRRSLRRLVGMVLAALPLGAGFLMVLFSERRRGLHDRYAGTEVVYADVLSSAPWSGEGETKASA